MEMQGKLEEYRIRKRRKEKFEVFKSKIKSFLMLGTGRETGSEVQDTTIEIDKKLEKKSTNVDELDSHGENEEDEDLVFSTDDEVAEQNDTSTNATPDPREVSKLLKYTLWLVYLLLWSTLYIIAIELKFGIVFLMFSALFAIYFNTRTRPKKRNEISAYSVFNKDFKSIDGTLKAEQFERELMYGPTSMK